MSLSLLRRSERGSPASGIPSAACGMTSMSSGVSSRRNSRSLPSLAEARTRRRRAEFIRPRLLVMRRVRMNSHLPNRVSWTGYSFAERTLLRRNQLADAALGERNEGVHLRPRERRSFRGPLHFDDAAAAGHDHVHVGIATGVLR